MYDKLKDIWTKIKGYTEKINPKLRKMILTGLIAAVALSVGVTVYLNTKPYEVLFTGLNEEEASEIIGKLQESAVDYKYENNGTILVPHDKEEQLKAQLVYEGYPKSGFTYDIFKENVGLMSTDTEKQSYLLFDLQNRLGSTISLFDGVKDAKVTIALGEENKYVLTSDDIAEASASVVVIMKSGGSPTTEQVKGIQRLVSKSIPGLEFENVVVIDGDGNDVTVDDSSSMSSASKIKIQLEQEVEKNIKANVLNVLGPIYGADNIRISVKSSLDIDKKIREIINYSSPNGEGSQTGIPASQSVNQEITRDGEGAAGVPGTETNADIPIYGQIATDGTETYIKNQNDIEYYVNQIKEQIQADAGTIVDLSVSVVINGEGFGGVTERQLVSLIAKAAGIAPASEAEKITVVSAPFYSPEPDFLPDDLIFGLERWKVYAIGGGAVLILIVVIVLIIARKQRKKKKSQFAGRTESFARENTVAAEKAPDLNMELLNIKNEKGLALKESIRDFAEQNPEISAQLIKTWLKGGDTNG